MVLQCLGNSETSYVVLPAEPSAARNTLHALQVTSRSPMGGLALHAGAIRVANHWITLLGCAAWAHPAWNDLGGPVKGYERLGALYIAFDALGGAFAVDGGGLGGTPGTVSYFGPRELRWISLDVGYSQFLRWATSARTAEFYATERWEGADGEVAALAPGQVIAIYPPLWAQGEPLGERHRSSIAAHEAFCAQQLVAEQLGSPR